MNCTHHPDAPAGWYVPAPAEGVIWLCCRECLDALFTFGMPEEAVRPIPYPPDWVSA